MNTPGVGAGNWTWRAREEDFTDARRRAPPSGWPKVTGARGAEGHAAADGGVARRPKNLLDMPGDVAQRNRLT